MQILIYFGCNAVKKTYMPQTMMVWPPCCRFSRHDVLVGEHDAVVAHISYTAEHDAVGEVTRAVVIAGGVGSLFKSTITSQGHITEEQLLCEVETEKTCGIPPQGEDAASLLVLYLY